MILRISSGVFEALFAEAAKSGGNECCGLVTGKPGLVEKVVPAKNVSPHPDRSFEIDPGTLLSTHRIVRETNAHVLGHYHSHPDGNPEPSPRDAARATHNGQVWLIIAGGRIAAWEAVTPGSNEGAIHDRFVPVKLLPV